MTELTEVIFFFNNKTTLTAMLDLKDKGELLENNLREGVVAWVGDTIIDFANLDMIRVKK